MVFISSMIDELEKDKRLNCRWKNSEGSTNQSMLLLEPATNNGCYHMASVGRMGQGTRFPWIQSNDSDPTDFHSWYVLPSKNHFAVPLWWELHAILWFVDGSGGESHLRRSCRIWLPVRMIEPTCPVWIQIGNHERSIRSTPSAACWITSLASLPSRHVMG